MKFKTIPIKKIDKLELDESLVKDYLKYLEIRIEFLLDRFNRNKDFPGVQTGYNSITGEEFSEEDIYSYSWINGRGLCVFVRFADYFPNYKIPLLEFASHIIGHMRKQWEINNHHFPFMANFDGTEKDVGCTCPEGYKSYSDLYACIGLIEYGSRLKNQKYIKMAQRIFKEIIYSLESNKFISEPDPIPSDRLFENPWSCALDLANEFAKHLDETQYIDIGAKLIEYLLSNFYFKKIGVYVEFITPDGDLFVDEKGRYTVDPGHSIEFCSFCLEFCRIAENKNLYKNLCERIKKVIPGLLIWNVKNGWNKNHPGIYKTINAKTGDPINNTMPWWILPETMLAVILAYERDKKDEYLDLFKEIHNGYFTNYVNPITDFGPFQNIDGNTGKPIDIIPACKFQDPEFHAGKNILTVTEVIKRLNLK